MKDFKQPIPTYFELGGVPIDVLVTTYYKVEDSSEGLGQERSADGKILLATHFKGRPMPHQRIVNTFYHELAHSLFDSIGHELKDNELVCQSIGNLLMEYDRTKTAFVDDFLSARDDDNVFIKSMRYAHNCEDLEVSSFYKETAFKPVNKIDKDIDFGVTIPINPDEIRD